MWKLHKQNVVIFRELRVPIAESYKGVIMRQQNEWQIATQMLGRSPSDKMPVRWLKTFILSHKPRVSLSLIIPIFQILKTSRYNMVLFLKEILRPAFQFTIFIQRLLLKKDTRNITNLRNNRMKPEENKHQNLPWQVATFGLPPPLCVIQITSSILGTSKTFVQKAAIF